MTPDGTAGAGGRTATSRDVARLAGVSQSSVSLVLNGGGPRHGLSDTTQARVRVAAQALGYTPNHAARSLRRQRTSSIAFVTADLGNRYVAEVVTAAEEVARARGYAVHVVAAPTEAAEVQAVARLASGVSDGIILHGDGGRAATLLPLLRSRFACVLLQDPSEAGDLPCVRVDIAEGGRLATRHLAALGHRRIAHIADRRMDGHALNERLDGYRRGLAEAGLAFDTALVVAGENSFAGGDGAMCALLDAAVPPPTAVFVFNDQMAVGALHALHARGLRVPRDMAVVGFDGTDLGAFCTPELTTIDHPRHELGRTAANALLDRIEGRPRRY